MRDLLGVINWRRYTDKITTSGQPTEQQLAEIKALGVSRIINLGPHDNWISNTPPMLILKNSAKPLIS